MSWAAWKTPPVYDAPSGGPTLDAEEDPPKDAHCTVPNVDTYTVLGVHSGELADTTAGNTYLVGTLHPVADDRNSLTAVASCTTDTWEPEWTEPHDPDLPPLDRP